MIAMMARITVAIGPIVSMSEPLERAMPTLTIVAGAASGLLAIAIGIEQRVHADCEPKGPFRREPNGLASLIVCKGVCDGHRLELGHLSTSLSAPHRCGEFEIDAGPKACGWLVPVGMRAQ